VLYYFYYKWSGRVTFESLSDRQFSILGATGPDGCFNGEYAKLYEEGRVRAIADIDTEPIAQCHREHLQQIQVKANLVVPIVIERGLWGLLVAHHCRSTYNWSDDEIVQMRSAANKLASVPSIYNS
jgi:GAF domain-containing protein